MKEKQIMEKSEDGSTISRTGRFDVKEWKAFIKWCEQHDKHEWNELRQIVRERVSGRCVLLSGVKTDTLAELRGYADDLGVDSETAVQMIVVTFLAERRKKK
jgi:hypothetical protein